MNKIFDVHTHIYPEKIADKAITNLGGFYNYIPQCNGIFEDLKKRCREQGVGGFLLLTVATNAHQVRKINEYAASAQKNAREEGFTAFAFAGMHQDMPDTEKEAELDRCAEAGLCGVKLHPDFQMINIDDKSLYPLYEMLQSRGLPLCFHMGDNRPQYRYSEPVRLRRVLEDFPRLRVMAAHLGGYTAWDEALEELVPFAGDGRLMFDSSSSLGYMTPERARKQIDTLGTENVMFGTDYPSLTVEGELARFSALGYSQKELEDILWNNAAGFLGF